MTPLVVEPVLEQRGRAGGVSGLEELGALEDAAAIAAVKRGLPARLARQFSDRLGVPLETLAEPLHLTVRTLHRRMQEGRLQQIESERLHAVVRVFLQAIAILGDEAKAVHWLKSPVRSLGGRAPIACMETLLGLRQVENVLLRIDDVVYA